MAHKTSTYSPLIFKNFSHHGTKTSQKVTVCFTLPSAANCLPTMYCLGGPRRWKLLGPNTASRLETSYSTMDGRLWTTTTTTSPPPPGPTDPQQSQPYSRWLLSFGSNWVASKLGQLLIWSKLSPPVYRHWTLISPVLGCKPYCHGETNAKMWMAYIEVFCDVYIKSRIKFLAMVSPVLYFF